MEEVEGGGIEGAEGGRIEGAGGGRMKEKIEVEVQV